MLRTIIWFIYFWISLIFLIPSIIKVKLLDKSERIEEKDSLVYKVVSNWARRLIELSGCEIEVIGAENIPKDRNVLFVSNHQGNFDIPILIGYIEKSKGFIAKEELKKLPMINRWMKAMNCVFMDRDNPRESIKAIIKGIEILNEGYSLVIFPEGTRSKDGSLGEFKAGGLKLATKSEVPIVPVTIKGSNKIMEKGSIIIKPAKVEVIISPMIEMDNHSKSDTKEITEIVRNIIHENLEK